MPPIPVPTPRELLQRAKMFIPPLLDKMHKGQQGRVAVIGGCEDYTGAPYFSANASALLGADMSHVICEPQAAQVIKTYSPNIMVHPYMRQSHHTQEGMQSAEEISQKTIDLLERLHAIVIGPGLGRDALMQDTAAKIIEAAKARNMPMVVDADGLFLVQNRPSIIKGYTKAILTPNRAEFARLCAAMKVDPQGCDEAEVCAKLARAFGGVTIIQKGPKDHISNGKQTFVCDLEGGLKRSGGQGDTLTGSLVTFLAWTRAYRDRIWNLSRRGTDEVGYSSHDNSLSDSELNSLSAFGAAAVTRYCSRVAYEKKGRALQASDLSVELGNAFNYLFETENPKL
ncbi:unnamed protein product [Tuber aestivum]|uniref:ATP-dependent (S)-NAD(P)H-hydrate dehydratase n=1 Tax=Tuber aestivum TaxID=59557 RepID=A0A292PUW6_9PEZI|nr:unnamed protein product [Tuber aestivum]